MTANNRMHVLPFPNTYVNASTKDLLVGILVTDEILHPVDVVQPQGNGGNKPFHGDVDRKPEILFQKRTRQSSHCLRVLEIQAERYKQRLRVPAPSRSPHAGSGTHRDKALGRRRELLHSQWKRPGLPRPTPPSKPSLPTLLQQPGPTSPCR